MNGVVCMKRVYWMCYILSFALCVIGILCRDWLDILDKVFVIVGIALFLFTFARYSIGKAQRCPNCNAIIYKGHIRTVKRQQNGIVSCEKCGSLVCVDHSAKADSGK